MPDAAATDTPDPATSQHLTPRLRADREEAFNAATHAIGFALALVASAVLLAAVVRTGARAQIAACAVYAATMVSAYAASTMSHFLTAPRARNAFRTADQALIFLFITGTWAPIAVTWLLGNRWWWAFHAAHAAVAVAGFVSKAVFAHRVSLGTVSAALYLVLGWSPLLVARPVVAACPTALCLWLLAGGVCYTAGLLFFWHDARVPYFHATWHVLVVAGSACHYLGIFHYCTAPR